MSEPQRGEAARGYDLDRTTTFSDGVFAIAITLLVLSIGMVNLTGNNSHQFQQLWDKNHEFFAYFLSFAVIGKFWLAHHRMFGYLKSIDGGLIGLNLAYLAFIALTPFSTELLGDHGGKAVAVVVYATNLAIIGFLAMLMWRHAFRADLFAVDRLPDDRGMRMPGPLAPWMIFLASVPVALVAPGIAELMWLLVFFVQPSPERRFGTNSR